jgi:hypothetical protein
MKAGRWQHGAPLGPSRQVEPGGIIMAIKPVKSVQVPIDAGVRIGHIQGMLAAV